MGVIRVKEKRTNNRLLSVSEKEVYRTGGEFGTVWYGKNVSNEAIEYPVKVHHRRKDFVNNAIKGKLVRGVPLKLTSFIGVPVGKGKLSQEEDHPINIHSKELTNIQKYIQKELKRIDRNYQGETKEYLKDMLAYNVGQMVLNIDYKEFNGKTLDLLFDQLGATFEEVKEAVRRDIVWQEW